MQGDDGDADAEAKLLGEIVRRDEDGVVLVAAGRPDRVWMADHPQQVRLTWVEPWPADAHDVEGNVSSPRDRSVALRIDEHRGRPAAATERALERTRKREVSPMAGVCPAGGSDLDRQPRPGGEFGQRRGHVRRSFDGRRRPDHRLQRGTVDGRADEDQVQIVQPRARQPGVGGVANPGRAGDVTWQGGDIGGRVEHKGHIGTAAGPGREDLPAGRPQAVDEVRLRGTEEGDTAP